jgi:hypothetical protein
VSWSDVARGLRGVRAQIAGLDCVGLKFTKLDCEDLKRFNESWIGLRMAVGRFNEHAAYSRKQRLEGAHGDRSGRSLEAVRQWRLRCQLGYP